MGFQNKLFAVLAVMFFQGIWICADAALPAKPNILLIVADDLGYGDLGIQGCKEFATPNIDSIARNGMRFSNAYVSCPVCAPSRAGLLTGRYQDRFGFCGNPKPGAEWGLPVGEQTIASALKAAGYRTAVFGKWHLGEEPQYRPTARGFDEFYGFLSGKHSYWHAEDPHWGPMVRDDAEAAELPKYLTFALADKACGFIKESKPGPFFLYLAFNAPHAPMEAPPEYLEKTRGIKDPQRSIYAAMVLALDDAVGQVLDVLRQAGTADDTLVVFLSDNGGAIIDGSDRNGASNAPLRGSKAQLWEGGIRVPFLAAWPGKIQPGGVSDVPVISLDLFPTFAGLAGAKAPDVLDGLDLSDLLCGKVKQLPPRDLFWRFYDTQKVVRSGDIKWIRMESDNGLYNVFEDPAESDNRLNQSEQYRAVAEQLGTRWQEWDRSNLRKVLP
ncbi:MAG: sulfatase-like hydrolase/transferase [Kiritimatiellales bacterium]|nr:sulfatase-like hydrolase/transferase [Kiritimatiellales bacterium]